MSAKRVRSDDRKRDTRTGGKRSLLFAALLAGASAAALASSTSAHAQASVESVTFDIPSQPLEQALLTYARQAQVNFVLAGHSFGGAQSNPVRGAYDREQALGLLLEGTGVEARLHNGAIRFQRGDDTPARGRRAVNSNDTRPIQLAQLDQERTSVSDAIGEVETDRRRREMEDEDAIVVVGTNIRGVYPSSSPLDIYTAEDIARTGATTTEQFIQRLPQNTGTRTSYAANATASPNFDGVNTVDLRGLGVGTTLVLLNGRRMALSSSGQAADVSLIPFGAIARVEVLTDGASALYGSDAIGGVVNFVLRDDFQGAESRVTSGGVTNGGLRQGEISHTIGHRWRSGNLLAAAGWSSASALERTDRDFTSEAGPGTLTPHDLRRNLLVTFSQRLGEGLTLDGDVLYSRRDVKNEYSLLTSPNPLNHTFSIYNSETEQLFGSASLNWDIAEDLTGTLVASYANVDVDGLAYNIRFNRVPPTATSPRTDTNHTALDLTALIQGALFELPAGQIRFSLGGGVLQERYHGVSPALTASNRTIERATTYAFGELFLPLIGGGQGVPLIERLEISLAARYTSYEDQSKPSLGTDFGDGLSPRIGLLWAPSESVSLRATYSESFRAPSLTQLDPTNGRSNLYEVPVAGVPSIVLDVFGGPALHLDAETARSFTIGFDIRPPSHRGFQLSGTYFNIDYTDRIAVAPLGGFNPFTDPAALPDAIYRVTSAPFVEELLRSTINTFNNTTVDLSDPSAAAATLAAMPEFWVWDGRFRNLALSMQDGFDFSVRNRIDEAWGEWRVGAQLTHILDYKQRAGANGSPLTVVDSVLLPVSLRGRVFAGISLGGFDGTLSVNYVDGYENRSAVGGAEDVDSWTTLDLNLAYAFPVKGNLGGVRLGVSVQNLLDESPPRVSTSVAEGLRNPVGFDPANANPLGRLIVFSFAKSW